MESFRRGKSHRRKPPPPSLLELVRPLELLTRPDTPLSDAPEARNAFVDAPLVELEVRRSLLLSREGRTGCPSLSRAEGIGRPSMFLEMLMMVFELRRREMASSKDRDGARISHCGSDDHVGAFFIAP